MKNTISNEDEVKREAFRDRLLKLDGVVQFDRKTVVKNILKKNEEIANLKDEVASLRGPIITRKEFVNNYFSNQWKPHGKKQRKLLLLLTSHKPISKYDLCKKIYTSIKSQNQVKLRKLVSDTKKTISKNTDAKSTFSILSSKGGYYLSIKSHKSKYIIKNNELNFSQ